MLELCTPSSLQMGSGEHENAQPRGAPIITHCKANIEAMNMWAPYFNWCERPATTEAALKMVSAKPGTLMPRCCAVAWWQWQRMRHTATHSEAETVTSPSSLNQGMPFHQNVTRKVTRDMQRPSGWGSRS